MLDKYRIKFANSESLAQKDKTTLQAFADHRITADQACRRLELNNGIDHITWEQLIANVWWLGYQTSFVAHYIVTAETDKIAGTVRSEYGGDIRTVTVGDITAGADADGNAEDDFEGIEKAILQRAEDIYNGRSCGNISHL